MYVLFHAGSGRKGNFHAEFGASHGCAHGLRESLQEVSGGVGRAEKSLPQPRRFKLCHLRACAAALKGVAEKLARYRNHGTVHIGIWTWITAARPVRREPRWHPLGNVPGLCTCRLKCDIRLAKSEASSPHVAVCTAIEVVKAKLVLDSQLGVASRVGSNPRFGWHAIESFLSPYFFS
jgi:hypothetical protein